MKDLVASLYLEPNNAFALRTRGEVFRNSGMHKKAVEELTLALDLGPENIFALHRRGDSYYRLDKFDEAECFFP